MRGGRKGGGIFMPQVAEGRKTLEVKHAKQERSRYHYYDLLNGSWRDNPSQKRSCNSNRLLHFFVGFYYLLCTIKKYEQ